MSWPELAEWIIAYIRNIGLPGLSGCRCGVRQSPLSAPLSRCHERGEGKRRPRTAVPWRWGAADG